MNAAKFFPVLLFVSFCGTVAAALPKDPCALLKPAEIQSLAPNAKIGNGKAHTDPGGLGVTCTFEWGPRTKEWGESTVSVTVMDATKAYPGTDAATLQQGFLAKAKVGGPNASTISGVGDAGVFTFEARSSSATAETYLKGKSLLVVVSYHAGDSLASKDKIVTLLKAAASRL